MFNLQADQLCADPLAKDFRLPQYIEMHNHPLYAAAESGDLMALRHLVEAKEKNIRDADRFKRKYRLQDQMQMVKKQQVESLLVSHPYRLGPVAAIIMQ